MSSVVLKTVLAIGGITWIAILLIGGTVHLDQTVQAGGIVHESRALWAPYGGAITAASLFVWLFDRWLWRFRPFTLIAKRPDLHGTWNGQIISDWVDPETNGTRAPFPAFVCVTQTASTLYLRQFTAESESATLAATIVKEADDAESVAVVYRNEPHSDVRHCSPIHFGGMHLRVSGDDTLEGDYWTDRKSGGRVTLKRMSRAKCRSFAEAERIAAKSKA